jgi:hypothetical protein
MAQIRIWADMHSTGLINELGGSIARDATTISEETWQALQRWVRDYDFIIPLGPEGRCGLRDRIDELDRRGLQLVSKVRSEWPRTADGEPTQFVYRSEGLLREWIPE